MAVVISLKLVGLQVDGAEATSLALVEMIQSDGEVTLEMELKDLEVVWIKGQTDGIKLIRLSSGAAD